MTRKNNIFDRIAKPTPIEAKKNAKILYTVSIIATFSITGAVTHEHALYAIVAICGGGAVYNSQKVIK